MLYAFSRNNELRKAVAGLILAILAIVSVYVNVPAGLVHAAALDPLTAVALSEDPDKTTLGVGDQLIVGLNYQQSQHDLQLNTAGTCTVNGKDVKASFQSFNDGTYQLVYTVAVGDANAVAGTIPFSCAFTDTAGNEGVITGFTSANTLAISTDSTGGDDGGDNNGDLPDPGTFEVIVEPSTGTLTPGNTLIVRVNDTGGVIDFVVDPEGICTINGKDVRLSFQGFGDHRYQLTYTVGGGDPDVAAGQLAISCAVKNPAGITGTINTLGSNTLAISGGGNQTPLTNLTVSAVPSTGTLGVGQTLEVRIHQNDGAEDIMLDGTCTVNGVNVNNFENLHNGDYKVTYTVASSHANAAAGQVAFNCPVKNAAGQTATLAFTDSNTVAVNAQSGNNNGGDDDDESTADGTIDGDVEGGNAAGDLGILAVTSIEQVRGVAVADGTMENGWKWIFHITVPTNETNLQLKFGNWMHSNNVNSIAPTNTMRISSPQSATMSSYMVTAADTYTLPMSIASDQNTALPGKQIDVVVEMGVPVGSTNGAYSTTYHVKSTQ